MRSDVHTTARAEASSPSNARRSGHGSASHRSRAPFERSASKTGCEIARRRLTSPSARRWSRSAVRSARRIRCCVRQRRVRSCKCAIRLRAGDRDHRLLGEGLQQFDLAVGEAAASRGSPMASAPIATSSRSSGIANADLRSERRRAGCKSRFRRQIIDMDRSAGPGSPGHSDRCRASARIGNIAAT